MIEASQLVIIITCVICTRLNNSITKLYHAPPRFKTMHLNSYIVNIQSHQKLKFPPARLMSFENQDILLLVAVSFRYRNC